MWLHFAVFAVALAVMAKSADWLVEYATRLAQRLRVSDLVVGLVVTSLGTSLPELAASVSAALAESPGLVIGNVVGSNIANLGLVLGAAALVRPVPTDPRMYDRDGAILLASALLFFVAALDNAISRLDAAIFAVFYAAYVGFAARTDRAGIEHRFRDFLRFAFSFEYAAPAVRRWTRSGREAPAERAPIAWQGAGRELCWLALALALLIVSARWLVVEAAWLARLWQLPESLIGLSLIAIGTSLPELVVAIAAARRGRAELVIGNVIGSNLANTLLITALAAGIRPVAVSELSVVYTIPIMLFFTVALLHFVRTDWRIGRAQGVLALAGYAVFLAAAFAQGWA